MIFANIYWEYSLGILYYAYDSTSSLIKILNIFSIDGYKYKILYIFTVYPLMSMNTCNNQIWISMNNEVIFIFSSIHWFNAKDSFNIANSNEKKLILDLFFFRSQNKTHHIIIFLSPRKAYWLSFCKAKIISINIISKYIWFFRSFTYQSIISLAK